MPDTLILLPNQILNNEVQYAEAIRLIIAEARHELKIFDQDLKRGGFSSAETCALLHQFIAQNVSSRLTIIVHNTEFLQEKCPRLMQLIKVYSHKIIIYETNQAAKHAKDCFMIADGKHFIKRIHIDHARFKYNLNDSTQTFALVARFNDLLEETESIYTLTTLGL